MAALATLLCALIAQALPATAAKPVTSGSWGEVYYGFGRMGVGGSLSHTFTFTNTGTSTIRKPTIAIAGVEFALSGNTCATAVLSTNQTCTVVVTYTPAALGPSTGGTLGASFGKNAASDTLSGTGIQGLNDISIGENSTCAILRGTGGASAGVKCWGSNSHGQLGNDSTTDSLTPVAVSGLTTGVTAIRTGAVHACALVNGGVKCWGYNGDGELGNDSTTDSAVPVDVQGLTSGVTSLTVAATSSCAVTSAGAVVCWGYGNYGVLGNGSDNDSHVPTTAVGLTSGVQSVSFGGLSTCALLTSGAVKCWGYNRYGQLGDGTTTDSYAAVDVTGLSSGVTQLSAGGYHACVLMVGGEMRCWGQNALGQLGQGTTVNSSIPLTVGTGFLQVTASYVHTCARTTAGALQCWGYNYYGEVGNGANTNVTSPTTISAVPNSTFIASTGFSTCVIDTTMGAKCWGYNYSGQLGNGTTTNSNVPVDVLL